MATYQKADGSTYWFDSFAVRQNGTIESTKGGVSLAWGWKYEFPIAIEGTRHYPLLPFSENDVYESELNVSFEGPSSLINDDTGEGVGIVVTRSVDVPINPDAPSNPDHP